MTKQNVDVIIVGAGLSGIDIACHLKMKCPDKSFVIFEGREQIGGTWNLFKYPGIRSDSDMHTFSFGFKPWTYEKTISDAATILEYLEETVQEFELEPLIRFNHYMSKASWSSVDKRWTVSGMRRDDNTVVEATCRFLVICTGYYSYDEGYTPVYEGIDDFNGQFVHPQHWTPDIEYENKKVVVIGSGATAVTLIPTLAEKAKHVYMLQRSPTYILSRPLYDVFAKWVNVLLPAKMAHTLSRWKNILLSMYLYKASRKSPAKVKAFIRGKVAKALAPGFDVDTHFNPTYDPWDQRLCIVPDNDLFHTINKGTSSVVTDRIETFTERGIQLASGKELEADLVVSATGLKLKVAGGMEFLKDGEPLNLGKLISYKGIMLQDIPNAATIVGYTNASWTLKADLSSIYICRLFKYMDKKKAQSCTPTLKDEHIDTVPIIDFSSSYVLRSLNELPKQGTTFPWKLHQDYIKDLIILKYRKIDDGYLKFE